jgi:hypothetical protein
MYACISLNRLGTWSATLDSTLNGLDVGDFSRQEILGLPKNASGNLGLRRTREVRLERVSS